ncbi:MAG: DNA polymerase III subunit beta [Myxococcales bacterium]|jgi:DNA polymerase-3 subunit beta|nr:DNA polymerase III subunit beta [Myxococcales bacterium]
MEFKITVEELLKALSRAQGIAERKNTIPILANVLIEAKAADGLLRFTAFDLDIALVSEHPAEIIAEGAITLPAKLLFSLAKSLTGDTVHCKVSGTTAQMACGSAHCKIIGMPAEEYPTLPKDENVGLTRINGRVLQDLIAKTSFAISLDETRYVLNGLYFEAPKKGLMRAVSTDGHRLSLMTREIEDGEFQLNRGVIFPRKGLLELRRLIDEAPDAESFLGFTETSAIFKKSGLSMIMRLIDGQFPDYQEVIPQESAASGGIKLERKRFLEAIKFMTNFSDGRNSSIKLSLDKGLLKISANTDGSEGENELPVEYDGDRIEIGFNARYLIDALGALDQDDVIFELMDDQSPGVIRSSANKDFMAVIMPMRI